jgi:hypothetical protein
MTYPIAFRLSVICVGQAYELPGFEDPAGEMPTPPSEYIPLLAAFRRQCRAGNLYVFRLRFAYPFFRARMRVLYLPTPVPSSSLAAALVSPNGHTKIKR